MNETGYINKSAVKLITEGVIIEQTPSYCASRTE
jgi:hypothetical protein